MKTTVAVLFIMLSVVSTLYAAPALSPKMRPYTGIGLFMLPPANIDRTNLLPLYEEPGISRHGSLVPDKIPAYSWIFGSVSPEVPLIVMGRKGAWLRVAYDDAGREAWLNPARTDDVQTWEFYFRNRVASLLPGLQKKYLQIYQQPGQAVLATLTPQQFFKVLRFENDWAMVLTDQNSLGWLRWRDEDGRLLIGVSLISQVTLP